MNVNTWAVESIQARRDIDDAIRALTHAREHLGEAAEPGAHGMGVKDQGARCAAKIQEGVAASLRVLRFAAKLEESGGA